METYFLFSKTIHIGFGAHPASYSMGTGFLSGKEKSAGE
jgi:hypothetical protein